MRCAAVLLLLGACLAVRAHDVITTKVTWSREVSRLVYNRCASCHRPEGSAFSLMTYEDSRPWAKAIKEEVLSRRMPPWSAIKGFGEFSHDQALTQEDLELISDWVEGGAPDGDHALLPPAPAFGAAQPALEKTGAELVVDGILTLTQPVTLAGIRAKALGDGVTVQVIAERPDGSVEPLIWLYDYKAQFDRAYYYRKPIALPAGTRVQMSPADAGTVSLLAAPSNAGHS